MAKVCCWCGTRYCKHRGADITQADRKRRNELSRKRSDGSITQSETRTLNRLEEKARAYAERAEAMEERQY